MIVRTWNGQTATSNATEYFQHVTESVLPSLSKIAGFRGGYVLRRDVEGKVAFVVATLWDSMSAVREFAGEQPERAVVEPEARAVLTSYDRTVKHYEVAYLARSEERSP